MRIARSDVSEVVECSAIRHVPGSSLTGLCPLTATGSKRNGERGMPRGKKIKSHVKVTSNSSASSLKKGNPKRIRELQAVAIGLGSPAGSFWVYPNRSWVPDPDLGITAGCHLVSVLLTKQG